MDDLDSFVSSFELFIFERAGFESATMLANGFVLDRLPSLANLLVMSDTFALSAGSLSFCCVLVNF